VEVTLVIPAHNEEARLPQTVGVYSEALRRRHGERFEIIVVANGCSDHTADVVRKLALINPKVKLVDIPEPIGKGGAVVEGFRRATGGRVLFADADAATSPDSLMDLADQLDEHDVAIGSRRLRQSTITGKQPPLRRVFGHAFALAVRLTFGMPYRDTQCGAKAFRLPVAQKLSSLVTERRWMFDVDLLLAARALGLDVVERPVVWHDGAGSKLRVIPTVREVAVSLVRLRSRWSRASDLAGLTSPEMTKAR
jgi:glycosyltransferase involved in cell wall biosynthesis